MIPIIVAKVVISLTIIAVTILLITKAEQLEKRRQEDSKTEAQASEQSIATSQDNDIELARERFRELQRLRILHNIDESRRARVRDPVSLNTANTKLETSKTENSKKVIPKL